MLKAEQLKTLKSTNVSKNSKKMKERIGEDYKNATKDEKKILKELSGLSSATIANIRNRGTVSAKVILALAQTLNVSPYYYTGAVDDKNEYNEELQNRFLKECGYDSLSTGKRSSTRKKTVNKPVKSVEKSVVSENEIVAKSETVFENDNIKIAEVAEEKVVELSKNDIVTLVEALHIRAAVSSEAKSKLDGIKAILLS